MRMGSDMNLPGMNAKLSLSMRWCFSHTSKTFFFRTPSVIFRRTSSSAIGRRLSRAGFPCSFGIQFITSGSQWENVCEVTYGRLSILHMIFRSCSCAEQTWSILMPLCPGALFIVLLLQNESNSSNSSGVVKMLSYSSFCWSVRRHLPCSKNS